MTDKLNQILDGLLDPTLLPNSIGIDEEMMDVPLVNLGVDSLAIMVVLDRLEDDFGIVIDYDAFSVRDISTARKIATLLGNTR